MSFINGMKESNGPWNRTRICCVRTYCHYPGSSLVLCGHVDILQTLEHPLKQALREAYFRAEAVAQGAEPLLCKREHLGVNPQPLQKQWSPAVPCL